MVMAEEVLRPPLAMPAKKPAPDHAADTVTI